MTKEEIAYLLEQYMSGRLTKSQVDVLLEQTSLEHEQEMIAVLREYLEAESVGAVPADPAVLRAMVQRVLLVDKPAAPVRQLPRRRGLGWIAAAASVLILGGYVWYTWEPGHPVEVAKKQEQRFHDDVPAPSGSRTTLTLGSGKQLVLDSLSAGSVGRQGNAALAKVDSGRLVYRALGEAPGEVVYNTLTTGRGGQTSVVLADGTRVWLDASSSLRFPTTFQGKQRRVELKGQAYFEAATDPGKPMVVELQGAEVAVLGTNFNIKAYDDDKARVITLLSGAIRVIHGGDATGLTPGQQAKIGLQGGIMLSDHADLEEVMAWKNGYFVFHGIDMTSLLREAARWYDVDVANYRTDNPKFYGEVPRNTPLSDLLKALELSGHVRFGIEGKKIIVLP